MNWLVMITLNEDGDEIPLDERKWCFHVERGGSGMTLCTGEVFGDGEGRAEADMKTVSRGGITCTHCIQIIKEIKSVKL